MPRLPAKPYLVSYTRWPRKIPEQTWFATKKSALAFAEARVEDSEDVEVEEVRMDGARYRIWPV